LENTPINKLTVVAWAIIDKTLTWWSKSPDCSTKAILKLMWALGSNGEEKERKSEKKEKEL
jgi:hypothetical protein